MIKHQFVKLWKWFFPDGTVTRISQKQYCEDFGCDINPGIDVSGESPSKNQMALDHALDIRKFEIDLYWKRATYFWTFIGATFAGYGAVQALNEQTTRTDLSVFLSCLGIVFSFGWFCANKGSKQWQENWENHVDMLEDRVIGPLYKTVLRRREAKGPREKFELLIAGPELFSVSKINLIISLYVTVLWLFLLWRALPPFSRQASIDWSYVLVVGVTATTCFLFVWLGRTHTGSHDHHAFRRESKILDENATSELEN